VTFQGQTLRVRFRAIDPIRFPTGKAGNTLRGAFGFAAGSRVFRPVQTEGPSGLADPPRRFVFRAHHLDGATIAPGQTFHFDVHLFYATPEDVAEFRRIFDQLAHAGLGAGRARLAKERIDVSTPLLFPLAADPAEIPRVHLRFVTPTEIKSGGGLAPRPGFPILLARIRDRLSTLRALYGPGPLEIDFKGLAAAAAAVRMTRCDLQHTAVERRSSRTGETHPLGGFTGEAVYEGVLAPFGPWIRAAEFTGVGRHTVWGNGVLEIVEPQTNTD
jgi:hypothetical protein